MEAGISMVVMRLCIYSEDVLNLVKSQSILTYILYIVELYHDLTIAILYIISTLYHEYCSVEHSYSICLQGVRHTNFWLGGVKMLKEVCAQPDVTVTKIVENHSIHSSMLMNVVVNNRNLFPLYVTAEISTKKFTCFSIEEG
jgi:predicted membrane protein